MFNRERIFAADDSASRPLDGANFLQVVALRIRLAETVCAAVLGVPETCPSSSGPIQKSVAQSVVVAYLTVNLPLENSLRS